MPDLLELGWPLARVSEAIEHLADLRGMPRRREAVPAAPPQGLAGVEALGQWIEAVAGFAGLEAEAVDVEQHEVEAVLRAGGPALLRVPGGDAVWALHSSKGGSLVLLGPDRRLRRVPARAVRDALCRDLEGPAAQEIDAWLSEVLPEGARRRKATAALLRERLRGKVLQGCWLLRMPAGASFAAQLRADGLAGRVAVLLGTHLLQLALGLAAWWMLGKGALEGRLDRSLLVAWALLLLTTVPLRLLSIWAQGRIAVGVGQLLKRRLLEGALRIDPDSIRREGAGQLLGRAMEAGAIEALALGAGFASVLGLVELAAVFVVLGLGAVGPWHAALLGGCTLLTALAGWRAYRRRAEWAETRSAITHDLVEQMIGHRTRLAQQEPSRWHEGEDEALDRYLGQSHEMDRADVLVQTLPQLWFFAGLLALAPSFVDHGGLPAFAIGLGGVLLGAAALTKLTAGLMQLASAAIAWKQVRPLFEAASRPERSPTPALALSLARVERDASGAASPLLTASDLVFTHRGRSEPAVRGASLRIDVGDRLLLEGPSGGGKSTLASLLCGLRQPSSGLLLLDGVDFHTLGPAGWRRTVAAAPQYHDNHVLTETFAFNVLMGREWPPSWADLKEAEDVCRGLGLGELLDRMPAGMMQIVGETGWRLSHGERSRLFIARALLQRSSLIVLDESFAALDPETLEVSLRCVLERAPALMVIAHP